MSTNTRTIRERKLTTALFTHLPGVLESVRATGRLPPSFRSPGGGEIGLRILIERRGVDIELTEDERLVFDAIEIYDGPIGGAILIEDALQRQRDR